MSKKPQLDRFNRMSDLTGSGHCKGRFLKRLLASLFYSPSPIACVEKEKTSCPINGSAKRLRNDDTRRPVQKPNPREFNNPAGSLVSFHGASTASLMRDQESGERARGEESGEGARRTPSPRPGLKLLEVLHVSGVLPRCLPSGGPFLLLAEPVDVLAGTLRRRFTRGP